MKLLVAQRFHRIEARGEVGRNQRGNRADEKCADANNGDVARYDFRRNGRKLIDFARENLDVQSRGEPVTEFIAVTYQRHSEPQTRNSSKKTNDRPLTEKNPDDLSDVRSERFHD